MAELMPVNQLLSLGGKTAIVTGGAVGIGYGITCRLAEAGANVVVVDRTPEDTGGLLDEAKNKGWKLTVLKGDVSIEENVKYFVTETVNIYGGVDILINNAGIYPNIPFVKASLADFEKVLDVNLKGVFLCTKYVVEKMIAQARGGNIINITSIDAIHPSMVGLSSYDASKHGVWGFTKNIALELAQYKIWVNAIAPGGINTPGVAKAQTGVEMSKVIEVFSASIPMKRMGEPDDIGKVALFLVSDMASYMTGSQIVVDGGFLLT
jgi:2-dehydro-3-deoxy-D-gluconate 5-dehydrogenase